MDPYIYLFIRAFSLSLKPFTKTSKWAAHEISIDFKKRKKRARK